MGMLVVGAYFVLAGLALLAGLVAVLFYVGMGRSNGALGLAIGLGISCVGLLIIAIALMNLVG
jgi:hypothetical protein